MKYGPCGRQERKGLGKFTVVQLGYSERTFSHKRQEWILFTIICFHYHCGCVSVDVVIRHQ